MQKCLLLKRLRERLPIRHQVIIHEQSIADYNASDLQDEHEKE